MNYDNMSDEEREEMWRSESDARTLSEAEVIRNDEKRMGKAQEAATRLAAEQKEQADAMAKVGKGIIPYDKSPDPPRRTS